LEVAFAPCYEKRRCLLHRIQTGEIHIAAIHQVEGTRLSNENIEDIDIACRKRQMCLVHLLGDLEYVETYKCVDKHWAAFARKLRRLVGDVIRLWRRENVPPTEFASRRERLDVRLAEMIEIPWQHKEACRLVKRLRRHRNDLFTFLDEAGVPFENNHAERAIRPAVLIRKNSYNNRSRRGADTQAVLMSVYRTLKQRGHHLQLIPLSKLSRVT